MKKVFFFILFVLINLILFEFLLSFFDRESILVKGYDKENLFLMYPNLSGMVVSEEYSVRVDTNEFGYRQNLEKEFTYSTLVIGDSFTEGWGVPEKYVYTQIYNLDAKEKLLNLGLHGSSPILYALQLKNIIQKWKPKKIIIQLFDNDLDDNEKIEVFVDLNNDGTVASPKKRLLAVLFGESVYNFFKERILYRLTAKIIKFMKKEPSPTLYYKVGKEPNIRTLSHEESLKKYGNLKPLCAEINVKYGNQFGFYKDFDTELWQIRLQKNKIYLEQIVSIAKQNQVELEFLYIPAKEFFAEGGILGNLTKREKSIFDSANPHSKQIREVCTKHQLKCYFLSDSFLDKDSELYYFPFDAHLNQEGHQKLAEVLKKGF
jgi:hypothetical protein